MIDLSSLPTMEQTGTDKGKVLIHGEPGTGKTTLATSVVLAKGVEKALYLYFPGEQGIASVPTKYRPKLVPYLARNPEEVNTLLWQLQDGDHPFDAVVIEGVASWQNLYSRYVQGLEGPRDVEGMKRRLKKKPDMRNVGGDVGALLKDDIVFWYALGDYNAAKPIHVVMTSQTKHRQIYEKTEDPNTQGPVIDEWIGPDVFPGLANAVEATPDYILYTYIDTDGDFGDDGASTFCVRTGPHELIRTKIHQDIDAKVKWPHVVGKDGKRLTLDKFLKVMGRV